MNQNYPDDIREHDDKPGSPFYKGPPTATCEACGEEYEEGDFYEKWLDSLDPTDELRDQQPQTCPKCDPKEHTEVTSVGKGPDP